MSKQSFCTVCRASLPSGAAVCKECGTPTNLGPQESGPISVGAVAHHGNPGLAAVLSFLIPGLGQGYLRRWKSAAAWFFGSILLLFILDGFIGALSYFLSVDATGPAIWAIIVGGLVIRIASALHARKVAD